MTKKSFQLKANGGLVALALTVVMAIVCVFTGLPFYWAFVPLALPIVAFLATIAVILAGICLVGAICVGVIAIGLALLLLLLPLFIIMLPFIDFDD